MRVPDHPLLAPYKAAILAAEKPTAEIILEPCGNLTLSQSKIGGLPYLPPDAEYPRNPYRQPLTLLAQINFAEMPPLPDFPTSGILQWFIDLHGLFNCWGLNSKDPLNQDGFRVLYYPEVLPDDALVRDFSFLENVPPVPPPKRSLWRRIKDWGMEGENHPPFVHPCAIRFQSGSQFPSFQDCTLHLRGEGFRRVGASPGVLQHVLRGWFHRLLRGLKPDRDLPQPPLLHRRHQLLRRRGTLRRNRY